MPKAVRELMLGDKLRKLERLALQAVSYTHLDVYKRQIEESITVTMLTHNNYPALSGACAVSCAVSKALSPDADLYSVLQAALYGAKEGERRGREVALDVASPSVVKRLEKMCIRDR